MSQKGSTLSLYPSSVTCYNTADATAAANNNSNIMNDHHHNTNHHSSDDDDDDDHDPSSKNGIGGGKSRRELPSGAVATLKAWLLAPEHFTHPYPTPQDQVMLMQKTGIDKKQLKNWFTNARRRIWKPMLKKQLEAGKLAAGVSMTTPGVTASRASLGGVEGGGEGGMPTPELMGSFQQQQQQQQQNQRYSQHQQPEPQQEMYNNFQQAQTQQHQVIDPSPSYEQQQQQQQYQQQQVQFLQDIGQMHQQPVYDQYGNQIYENTASSYQQQYPYQQDNQSTVSNNNNNNNMHHTNSSDNTNNNFPISNSIGSLPPMTLGGSSMGGGGGGSASSLFGNNMVKTDSHAVLMELFARDQDLVRQAASKGMAGSVVAGGGSINAGGGQQPQGMVNNNGTPGGTDGGGGVSSASSTPGNVRWAAGSVGGGGVGSGPVLQKQHSVTFEGVSSSLSSWPNFSSVSSLNNLGGLQGVKSITNLSAADLSSQGNLNKMGNLAHVKSFENMGRFDSFAFLEVFFDDKSGLNSSIHGNNGLRGVKRERDDDDAVGLSLDGDDGTSSGQFNNSSNKSSSDQGPDPASDSGGEVGALLTYEDNDGYEGNEMDGGTLKRAYDDALAARGLIAVRRSCEKLTDLALPAKMQRTLSQEYIRQHNQGQHMGDFFSTNNSAYAPNSRRNSNNNNNNNNNNCSLQMVLSDGGGNGIMNTSSVEVPSSTTCKLCMFVNVDTQLRPCGHMFHGHCLKPSLQITVGPPKCPICNTSMQSAILAVPTAATESSGSATMG